MSLSQGHITQSGFIEVCISLFGHLLKRRFRSCFPVDKVESKVKNIQCPAHTYWKLSESLLYPIEHATF